MLIEIIQFSLLICAVYIMVEWAIKDYISPVKLLNRSKMFHSLNVELQNLNIKRGLRGKVRITTLTVIIISAILFLIFVFILFIYIRILSTAVILSLPILISPIIISKILVIRNKEKISKQIPFYTINIKNQMKEDNDIVQAIKRTKVEEPLKKHIDKFKLNVFNGMNVISAMEKLKNDVDVKDFGEMIETFEVCYKNGGDFVKVLEKIILMKTKERMYKEETEEKAFTSVVTLIIMMLLSVFVIATFVFGNLEYANIVRSTFGGKLILNLTAISYMVMTWIIAKVYKED